MYSFLELASAEREMLIVIRETNRLGNTIDSALPSILYYITFLGFASLAHQPPANPHTPIYYYITFLGFASLAHQHPQTPISPISTATAHILVRLAHV